MMARASLRAVVRVLLLTLVLAACSDDRGPGTIQVEISGPVPLGAGAVELVGGSVEGVRPLPDGWVAGHPFQTSDGQPGFRVVAVVETPGTLVLEVEVADLDDPLPEATLVEAVDAQDLLLANLSAMEVRVRR